MFLDFLKSNGEKYIWVATPAGIFYGKIAVIGEDTFSIDDAQFFADINRLGIDRATIKKESVFAWGKEIYG
jgi:hypothetical protein